MNWNDISFKQYIDIDTIVKDTELTEEERCFALVQAVYGINLLNQPLTEYKKYVNSLTFLKEKMPEMTLNDTYEVNGTVYEFHRDVKDLTVGAFMDYQNYSKGEKNLDTYANILTIFLIPKGCKYNDGYDIVKARRDMLDLPAPVALSMAAFFNLLEKLCQSFPAIFNVEDLENKGDTEGPEKGDNDLDEGDDKKSSDGWGLLPLIMFYVKETRTPVDKVFDTPVGEFFYIGTYLLERNEKELARLRAMKRR